MLSYPHLLTFSCDDCGKWIYNIETGKQLLRGGKPQARQACQPTPCHACPKESPAKEREKILTARNVRTLMLFIRNRALHGAMLNEREKADALLCRLFGLLDWELRAWESSNVADMLANALARIR